jgi:hypothetical protein
MAIKKNLINRRRDPTIYHKSEHKNILTLRSAFNYEKQLYFIYNYDYVLVPFSDVIEYFLTLKEHHITTIYIEMRSKNQRIF